MRRSFVQCRVVVVMYVSESQHHCALHSTGGCFSQVPAGRCQVRVFAAVSHVTVSSSLHYVFPGRRTDRLRPAFSLPCSHAALALVRYQRAVKRCANALRRMRLQQQSQLAVLCTQWDSVDRERVEGVAKTRRDKDLALVSSLTYPTSFLRSVDVAMHSILTTQGRARCSFKPTVCAVNSGGGGAVRRPLGGLLYRLRLLYPHPSVLTSLVNPHPPPPLAHVVFGM
jgi:hypothetical protein